MPGRSGIDLMSIVGREHPECRVLVLTGYYSNLQQVREQFRKMPQRTSILTKPCRPEDLLREADLMLASA
jgi:DNA-binding NtrC family response regulator